MRDSLDYLFKAIQIYEKEETYFHKELVDAYFV